MNEELLQSKFNLEVKNTFSLHIPIIEVHVKNEELIAPINISDKNPIHEKGGIVENKRFIHKHSKESTTVFKQKIYNTSFMDTE